MKTLIKFLYILFKLTKIFNLQFYYLYQNNKIKNITINIYFYKMLKYDLGNFDNLILCKSDRISLYKNNNKIYHRKIIKNLYFFNDDIVINLNLIKLNINKIDSFINLNFILKYYYNIDINHKNDNILIMYYKNEYKHLKLNINSIFNELY